MELSILSDVEMDLCMHQLVVCSYSTVLVFNVILLFIFFQNHFMCTVVRISL